MLTADTITDEQIAEFAKPFDDMSNDEHVDIYDTCHTAIHAPIRSDRRREARAKIAMLITQSYVTHDEQMESRRG